MMRPHAAAVERTGFVVIIVQVRALTGNRWHTQFGWCEESLIKGLPTKVFVGCKETPRSGAESCGS